MNTRLALVAFISCACVATGCARAADAPAPVPKVVGPTVTAPTADEIAKVKGQVLQAVITTPRGDIHVKLFPDTAPISVANFVKLADAKFFDGLSFHRVVPGFVIQGGDPLSREGSGARLDQLGSGGPGYMIPAEVGAKNPQRHLPGTLAMADAGLNTAGSQFYLTYNATPQLDGRYTVFGRVVGDADLAVINQVKPNDRFRVVIVREGDGAKAADKPAEPAK